MTLDEASRDARIKGLLVRVGSGDLPVAKGEELRDSIKRFQGAGKFVIAHSQTFYSGGLGDYTAISAADQIWMQPVSSFFGTGTSTTTLFFKGLFDKADAVPQFVQRYEYKNAANVFTETDYTPAHREATMRILQSWYELCHRRSRWRPSYGSGGAHCDSGTEPIHGRIGETKRPDHKHRLRR